MVGDEAVSESEHQAFGPTEWSSIQSRAEQSDNLLEEAVATLTPFAGLTANGCAHLRENWIEWGDEFVTIRVPPSADCNQWKMVREDSAITERNEPCSYCQQTGSTDGFENLWRGEDGSRPRSYVATLHHEIAEPAVDLLDSVFDERGRSGMFAHPGSVSRAARRLIPTHSHESHSYSKLLRTGVSLYCYYGLEIDEIAGLTPYTKSTVRAIISSTPEVTQKQHNSYSYLRALNDREPASAQELASELGVSPDAVRKAFNRLRESDRVKLNKSEWPHEWSVVDDWTDPFVCEICGFQSPNLRGIGVHKQTHD